MIANSNMHIITRHPELVKLIQDYLFWLSLPDESSKDAWVKQGEYANRFFGKIFVIKSVRTATGLGLKESKDLVDLLEKGELPKDISMLNLAGWLSERILPKEQQRRMLRPVETDEVSFSSAFANEVSVAIATINNVPWSHALSLEEKELLLKLQTVIHAFLERS